MRQKLITLCPTSFEKASKMRNFSAWIRKQLLNPQYDSDELEYVKEQNDRMSQLLRDIIMGRKVWVEPTAETGGGWVRNNFDDED